MNFVKVFYVTNKLKIFWYAEANLVWRICVLGAKCRFRGREEG